ncbi:MAG: VOC family protein [Planctomycetota bacterium]
MRISYAIVFVSDMDRSVAFYRDTLGLPLRFESPEWTEFATDGATLALHASDGTSGGVDARTSPAGRCRPGLSVSDIDAFHERMTAAGVRCIEPPRLLHGTKLATYADPDGLAISVSEERVAK